jgi:hypothetical protein
MFKKLLLSVVCVLALAVPAAFANTTTYVSYQNSENHFTMDLPQGFTMRPSPRPEVKVTVVHPENRGCLQVAAQTTDGKITKKNRSLAIKNWANAVVSQLRRDPINSAIDSGMTNIAGHEAAYVKYVCTLTVGTQVIPLYVERYTIEAHDCYYQITNSVDAAAQDQYKPIFDHSVQSFFVY